MIKHNFMWYISHLHCSIPSMMCCLLTTLCFISSETWCRMLLIYMYMTNFTCYYLPLTAFSEFSAINNVCVCAGDLNLFPIPSPAVLFHPTRLSSSSVHKAVKVQISQFRVRQLYPVFARGHALSSNRPFTLYLSIMICLVTSVFFWNLLNEWTPPWVMPQEMSYSRCV